MRDQATTAERPIIDGLTPGRTEQQPVAIDAAYAFCARLAKSHYENFTVASWLMPREMRKHMHAIYAYARIADDFADEDRDLGKLQAWEDELNLAYQGRPRHPVFVALADTVTRYDIPRQPFLDLLSAFRSDIDFGGFETLSDLLGYCANSANPVGRLVLYLFGYRDSERQALSDKVCSRLQLANFWQDVAIDLSKHRVYLPRRDMVRFGVTADDLGRGAATAQVVGLLKHEIAAARAMLIEGAALHRLVDNRLKRDILLFAGGGLAILRAIERVGCDVFRSRPKLTRLDYLKLGWDALRGTVV